MADAKKEKSCIQLAISIILILGFVAATIVILCISRHEHLTKPIRIWLAVSLGLCCAAAILSCCCGATSFISAIMELASIAWWIVGLVWIISGGEKLLKSAPILFWYIVVDLGLGVAGLVCLLCFFSCVCFCGTIAAADTIIKECGRHPDARV